MKSLKELINLVTRNKVKNIPIIDLGVDSLINRLYVAVQEHDFREDKEAELYLYPKGNNTFRSLKSRLKRRLYNTLFFIDVSRPEYNVQQEAYYTLWKNFATAKILMGKSAHYSSIELLENILKKSIKYEFPVLVRESAKELRRLYGTIKANRSKMIHYDKVYEYYKKLSEAEAECEKYYTYLVSSSLNSKTKENLLKVHQEGIKYYKIVRPYLSNFSTNKLHLHGRLIELIIPLSIKDHDKVITVCNDAISFFRTKESVPKSAIQIFLHRFLNTCIISKNYKNGKKLAEESSLLLGQHNYFINQKLLALLCFYTKKYEEVYSIVLTITTRENFNYQSGRLKESWLLYKAYTQYLISLNKITPPTTSKRFRLGKFLNEVPDFSKDKRGMNIPILIIQILFLIHRKKHDAAIDRIESLQWYGAKHIRKDENFRTNCFIKMLGQLPKAGFSAKRVERHVEKYKQKLLTMPIDKADQAFEIEVIPYEDLWGMVMESL